MVVDFAESFGIGLALLVAIALLAFAVGFVAQCGIRFAEEVMDQLDFRREARREVEEIDDEYEFLCDEEPT